MTAVASAVISTVQEFFTRIGIEVYVFSIYNLDRGSCAHLMAMWMGLSLMGLSLKKSSKVS